MIAPDCISLDTTDPVVCNPRDPDNTTSGDSMLIYWPEYEDLSHETVIIGRSEFWELYK